MDRSCPRVTLLYPLANTFAPSHFPHPLDSSLLHNQGPHPPTQFCSDINMLSIKTISALASFAIFFNAVAAVEVDQARVHPEV